MKRIRLLVFTLVLILPRLMSQEIDNTLEYPKTVVRLRLLLPGLLVEQNIKKNKSTIVFDIGTGITYQQTKINGLSESDLYFVPYLNIEPRFYLSYERRKSLGKRIDYNSGPFLGFQLKFGIKTKQLESWQSFGLLGGFQRTLWKKGFWNIGLGVSSMIYNSNIYCNYIGDFGIGIILN